MDDVIVISHSDESEEDKQICRKSRRRKRKRPLSASPTQDIIDLTCNSDVLAYVTSSDDVIDLTSLEEDASHETFQQLIKCNIGSLSDGGSDPESEGTISSPMKDESCSSKDLEFDIESSECSFRSANSSICSIESTTDLRQPDEADLPSKSNLKHHSVNSSNLQASHNQDDRSVHSDIGTQVQHITSSTPIVSPAMQKDTEDTLCSPAIVINKSLLYKFRHFRKPPVSHLLPPTLRWDQNSQPAPMPLSRMNIVNNTKDESFHQGTLYFLSEFVSASHYPPKDAVSHVINSVLLGAEEQTTRHDAYMMLMKIQRLHPAASESVAWEWKLLSDVMSKQEHQTRHLFLQYVVQTLHDDFHLCLQRRNLHKCLCKSMLSCNQSFCNVKQVIHWLIDAVKQIPETRQESVSQCNLERAVCLLQRMISIAVEVDNTPTMNSNKIADYIFPYVTVLKTRQQRELFFKSTENILLRAKILELIFHHNCESPPPQQLSLCFGEILYFINKSTLQLENQGPDWQRWDEMLHHIITFCLSLQTIKTDRLRTPVIDRLDEMVKRPQSLLFFSEDITKSEVDTSLALFKQRTSPGAEPPAALLNRLLLLQSLLYTAVKKV